MFCEQCGAVVPEGMRFCDQCGAPVEPDASPPVQSPIMEQPPMPQGMMQPQGQPVPPQPMQQPQYMNRPGMPMGRMPAMSPGAMPPPVAYENKKKSPLVPIIIIVAAVLIFGLGGFGVYKNIDKIKALVAKEKEEPEEPPIEEPPVKEPPVEEPPIEEPVKEEPVKEDPEKEESVKEEPEEKPGKRDPVDDEKPEENTGRENAEDRGIDQGFKSSGSGSGNVTITDIVERARVKSGAPNAELDSVDPDGTLNIRLYGSGTQDTWDWYYINPSTLKGTDILGNPVNLE